MNSETTKTYRSRFDPITFFLAAIIGAFLALTLLFFTNNLLVSGITFLIVMALVIAFCLSLRYAIKDHYLCISSVFSSKKINTFQISSLHWIGGIPEITQLSSFSRQRIRIVYGYGEYIDVSPRDTQCFIKSLISINPMIQFQQGAVMQE
ncbi:MAG: PH domain-containing protein [Cyclobacteriaceae bacterium]